MRMLRPLLVTLPLLSLLSVYARDASACGGCFVPPNDDTQVTGHRMVLSVSTVESTLWDQIEYVGDPAEFAWVLPTKGLVDVGVSSDLLLATLDFYTGVTVVPPPLNCPPPPYCNDANSSSYAATGPSSGAGGNGGVEVIAQEVVGPYETVQLAASDPMALKDWLTSHAYSIPTTIGPIIDAYVAEGFGFLALKLVPGTGIDSMRPVRVTTPGASPSLPLRMVAAGTGAVTTVTLWVVGEGKYEPTTFPSFEIEATSLIWDWDASSSNYTTLRAEGYDSTGGLGWLLEAGEPMSKFDIEGTIQNVVDFATDQSGYGDGDYNAAVLESGEDLQKLTGNIDAASFWVTRMRGELPAVALATDLDVGAAASQAKVDRVLQVTNTIGTKPVCPEYPPCNDTTSDSSGSGFQSTTGSGGAGTGGSSATPAEDSGCDVGGAKNGTNGGGIAAIALLAGALLARRRRG